MRILHVVYSCVPGEYPGGVPRVVYELSCAQSKHGHDVTVFTTSTNGYNRIDSFAGRVVQSQGVQIHYFPIQNRRWFTSDRLRRTLLVKGASYDVVHSHNTFLALNCYAAQWSKRFGRPVFFHIHGALDPKVVNKGLVRQLRKRIYIQWVERKNYAQASALFTLTDAEEQQLGLYKINAPMVTVPNGVHVPQLDLLSNRASKFLDKHQISSTKEVIVYVGRIVPKKGLHLLVSAFGEIQKRFPATTLVIAGDRNSDTSYTATLDQLIKDKQIGHKVCWTGFLNDSEKQGALGAASVFSHVTESEGMAMAVLEAMAAGLPTLVSDKCHMDDAVRKGALVECSYHTASIITEISALLKSLELRRRIGRRARAYVTNHHDWSTVATQIVDVYRESTSLPLSS